MQKMSLVTMPVVISLVAASASAFATDAVELRFVRTGMGEDLSKIRKADYEAFIRIAGARGKGLNLFTHPKDPQTPTILTLHAEVVFMIERKIARWVWCSLMTSLRKCAYQT